MTASNMSVRSVSVVALTAVCCYVIGGWSGAFVGVAAAFVLIRFPANGPTVVGAGAVLLLGFAAISSLMEAPVDPAVSFASDRPNAASAARIAALLVVAGLVVEVDRTTGGSGTETEESTGS